MGITTIEAREETASFAGKWKTRNAGTGTGTEMEIRKRSSDLKVSMVRLDIVIRY